jgi:asparagine N-glycosylation enzyme membrane subunit Stt3
MRFPSPRFTSNPWYWLATAVMLIYLVLAWTGPLLVATAVGIAALLCIGAGLSRDRRH